MPFTLKSRWRFIYNAVREEFKRGKWYKAVSILAAAWFIECPKPFWRQPSSAETILANRCAVRGVSGRRFTTCD